MHFLSRPQSKNRVRVATQPNHGRLNGQEAIEEETAWKIEIPENHEEKIDSQDVAQARAKSSSAQATRRQKAPCRPQART
jgi:hypothetical protein